MSDFDEAAKTLLFDAPNFSSTQKQILRATPSE